MSDAMNGGSDVPIEDPWAKPGVREKRKGLGALAWTGIALATLAASLLVVWLTVLHRAGFAQIPHAVAGLFSKPDAEDDKDRVTPSKDEVERKQTAGEPDTVKAPLSIPHDRREAAGSVPKESSVKKIGNITVITLGTDEPPLREALAQKALKARADGKELLLMLREASCGPCDGVIQSLSNDLMQKALAPIEIVIIDKEVFKDDLKSLKASFPLTPNFILLASDMSPRDEVDGGEWGEDIPKNIAPVLGPFVRGQLGIATRKHKWRQEQAGGVVL